MNNDDIKMNEDSADWIINELYKARDKAENLQETLDSRDHTDQWRWRELRELDKVNNCGLPVPRLELRWKRINDWSLAVDYGLVYQHCTGETVFVPMGSTKIDGKCKCKDFTLETELPFREGAHVKHDMKSLNLRGFFVAPPDIAGEWQWRELELRDD